jgi:hypothetical protein
VGTYTTLYYALDLAGRVHDALEDTQRGYRRAREFGLERAVGSLVASNLAHGLLVTGRWQECERLTREVLTEDSSGIAFAHLHAVRGVLLVRRGEFLAAGEQLDLALRLTRGSTTTWPGLGSPNSPFGKVVTTRRAGRLPRGCAGARSETPTGAFPSSPASGMR